jgi:hypothetical protein
VSKSVRVQEPEVILAVEQGADRLIIGQRQFLLVEVDKAAEVSYRPTDSEEVAMVREAIADKSPRLSGEAAREFLKARLRDHGIGYMDS